MAALQTVLLPPDEGPTAAAGAAAAALGELAATHAGRAALRAATQAAALEVGCVPPANADLSVARYASPQATLYITSLMAVSQTTI